MSRSRVAAFALFCLMSTAAFGALDLPSSMTIEAEGPNGATVYFTVSVVGGNDGSDGRPADTVTCSPASGSLFPLGTTTVSCAGSEGSTGSFPVNVVDQTSPEMTVPRDFTVVTQSQSGAVVTYTATATDLVDGSVAISCSPSSGSTFPVGTTAVSCTASDSRGNTATEGFNITVSLTEPPPGNPDITAEATGPTGARVYFNTGDEDDDDGRPGSGGCSPAPGSLFPLGTTTVVCPSGNFIVEVVDTTGPYLELPSTVTAVATSASGAAVTYSVSATDLVDGEVGVDCIPASGSTFAIGTSTVYCSGSDSRGNTTNGTFQVIVTTGVTPFDITAEATGPNGAVVSFHFAGCSPASGSTFPLGNTLVTCTAGNFTVTVVDTTPPTLTLPADITAEATGPTGAVVTYSATATDLVDGSVAVVCEVLSGATFPIGTTHVSCSATDAHNNTAGADFNVTVVDTTPPDLTLPADMTVEATSAAGAVATFSATATDIVDGSVAVTCTPASGSTFALGTTVVSCSATDAHNNTASGSFTVTVVDTTAPEITSVTVSPSSIWPPDNKLVEVVVEVQVSDAVDPAPLVRIYDITCDETIGSGDAVITGNLTAKLRADRDGAGDGRVYTLYIEAIDASGNRSVSTVTVTVPHDQKKRSVGRR